MKYDFSGWATRNNLKCSDGRTILKDAFKHDDGQTVPLVWNHQHNDPTNVLGHALLENREEGVYAYCTFNNTEKGQMAKEMVKHGDVKALSIYANQLKEQAKNVFHGAIREVSLVLAGANPGAFIDSIISHSENSDGEAVIFTGEELVLEHAETEEKGEEKMEENEVKHAEETAKSEDKTVEDVFNEMTEEQKTVVYALIGQALEDAGVSDDEDEESKGGEENMKHNVFETDNTNKEAVLSHSDQEGIIALAKTSGVGSFQDAVKIYGEQNGKDLSHAFSDETIEELFPEFKDVKPGAPELLKNDLGWVSVVMQKTHKSPVSRVRTRQVDARGKAIRGKGYKKGEQKVAGGNVKLLNRTTDPQTIYITDKLNRDDIIDITDFSVVDYQYGILKDALHEEIATAILFGDGREDGDDHKIDPTHIRPIYGDDELYTIYKDVELAKAEAELNGTNTGANFGENYINAEAFVAASLYSREAYKGSGSLDMYVTPHQLNVMLLARDLNGRRIYQSINDLAAALDVKNIYTVEQMEGVTRKTKDGSTKKLLALMVNLADYQCGATKGGQITSFKQFDIDFNQEKYLIETRMSGALVRVYSAIALEETVEAGE